MTNDTSALDAKWNANADIDGDDFVGLLDVTILAIYYEQRYL